MDRVVIPKPEVITVKLEKKKKEYYESFRNPSFSDFIGCDIFKKEELRMKYLRDLNNFIETKLVEGLFRKDDVEDLTKLSRKLWVYLITHKNRKNLSDEHRCSIWIIRCRIDYVLHLFSSDNENNSDFGNPESFPVLSELCLIKSDDNIHSYYIEILMLSLESIGESLCELKLFEEVIRYVRCLYISCAKYLIADTTDDSHYNIEKYKRSYVFNDHTFYGVSMQFHQDAERMFYEIERKIWVAKQFSYETEEFLVESDIPILDSLAKKFSVDMKPANQFLEPEIQEAIFKFLVAPGERERFAENNKFRESNPYNIVTYCRPEKAKAVISLFEKDFFKPVYNVLDDFIPYRNGHYSKEKKPVSKDPNNFLERFFEGKKEEDDDDFRKYQVDYAFDLTCMIVSKFIFNNNIKSKNDFSKFLIFYDDITVPIQKNRFYHDHLPYIIQIFSEWGVWDPNIKKVHRGKTFVDCFLIWIKLLEKNPFNLREIDSMKENGLMNLISSINPVKNIEFDEFKEFLPKHYTEEDMAEF